MNIYKFIFGTILFKKSLKAFGILFFCYSLFSFTNTILSLKTFFWFVLEYYNHQNVKLIFALLSFLFVLKNFVQKILEYIQLFNFIYFLLKKLDFVLKVVTLIRKFLQKPQIQPQTQTEINIIGEKKRFFKKPRKFYKLVDVFDTQKEAFARMDFKIDEHLYHFR